MTGRFPRPSTGPDAPPRTRGPADGPPQRFTSEDECHLHWLAPSRLYTGTFVPHWITMPNRVDAIQYAHELIESGVTDRVTLRSTEVIT